MKTKVIVGIIVATLLWFLMFSPWTAPHLNFWLSMSVSAAILISLSAFWGKSLKNGFSFNVKDVFIGLGSAVVLWFVFYIGDFLATLMFDFAKPQVLGIYALKEEGSYLTIALLLLFLRSPAEEIYWRGFIQKQLCHKFGGWAGFFATTLIYALVHIWSFNFMLMMAALICGAFWGLIYKWRGNNLLPVVISHAVWNVGVFILFPIQ
jgi:membrane protease YdiL (CAAX protease family)